MDPLITIYRAVALKAIGNDEFTQAFMKAADKELGKVHPSDVKEVKLDSASYATMDSAGIEAFFTGRDADEDLVDGGDFVFKNEEAKTGKGKGKGANKRGRAASSEEDAEDESDDDDEEDGDDEEETQDLGESDKEEIEIIKAKSKGIKVAKGTAALDGGKVKTTTRKSKPKAIVAGSDDDELPISVKFSRVAAITIENPGADRGQAVQLRARQAVAVSLALIDVDPHAKCRGVVERANDSMQAAVQGTRVARRSRRRRSDGAGSMDAKSVSSARVAWAHGVREWADESDVNGGLVVRQNSPASAAGITFGNLAAWQ
nr:hypothetical protein B0A51_11799 [Rachicladosporium sp. CCFEE 5018]